MVRFGRNRSYFNVLPSITIGRGWAMIEWLCWSIDITRDDVPY